MFSWLSMGALTPLYAAGILTISLPILFHLIRRTPKGQTEFSSLMFLSPSPPRLTRRSRIDNWLLLLLRALALILIAFAFCRPFWRENEDATIDDSNGRKIVLLVDHSASMRRTGIWEKVKAEADKVLSDLGPKDGLAIYSYGDQVDEVLSFAEGAKLGEKARVSTAKRRVKELKLTWQGSQLGNALVRVADTLESLRDEREADVDASLQIVLISDMQQSSEIEQLQNYEWPSAVQLEVRSVDPKGLGNAGMHLILDPEDPSLKSARLRIVNSPESSREEMQVVWRAPDGQMSNAISYHIPPGESRVVKLPERDSSDLAELYLMGDEHDFDNSVFVPPASPKRVNVAYLGDEDPRDSGAMLFYLRRALFDSMNWQIELKQVKTSSKLDLLEPALTKLLVVTRPLTDAERSLADQYRRAGGTILMVLLDLKQQADLNELVAGSEFELAAGDAGKYRLVGSVDYEHPIFAELRSVDFVDLTSVHFWKYRQLQQFAVAAKRESKSSRAANNTSERADDDNQSAATAAGKGKRSGSAGQPTTILALDNDAPLLLDANTDQGHLLVMTSGWNPDDSDFAVSQKFQPFVRLILKYGGLDEPVGVYAVGEVIARGPDQRTQAAQVMTPTGRKLPWPTDKAGFEETEEPGIYTIEFGQDTRRFAVNLNPAELQTSPMEVERLEQRGVRLGKQASRAEEAQRRRQKRDAELEQKQKVWQTILVIAVGLLLIETILAGYLSRQAAATS